MSMAIREPAAGEILGGNYLVERELGRGGFGVVYKARHVDIDRVVAIKVLLATYASRDPSAKDRFRREATIAASLSYPNSLKVFDYGETDEGVFYLVMEFVAGEDLTKVIQREGRLAPARAIHIARQVLYALSEAHARGIVHRDIKPDNIMLCPLVYDRDFVKVMDFGIAKMVDAGEAITRAGITLGTPRYMPVEQLKGERLGPASDLYAVGLVLYEMLCGTPAFRGETAVDTALAVMSGASVKVPAEAGVPAPLAAIIEKAAAKNAEDRYQSAREILDALAALDPAIAGVTDAVPMPAAPRAEAGHRATVLMPELEGKPRPDGDFEDVTRTQAIETDSTRAAALRAAARADAKTPPARSPDGVDRTAATQALEVQAVLPQATQTAMVTSAVDAAGLLAGAPRAAPPPAKPATATWLGAPPLVVVLQALALVLLVILALRAH